MRVKRTQAPVGYRVPAATLVSSAVRAPGQRAYRERVFEPEFAQQLGVRYACAVSSGKAALTVILLALHKLTGRKKVVIPAYTCYSVPSAIVKAGLEVVPCDVAKGSFDYDFEQLVPMLGPDVLCVLSVHLFGMSSDTSRLEAPCRSAGIFVVEDAAQALGCASQGTLLGTRSDVGFFSLGRGKNITCGSGGVIVTSSDRIAAALSEIVKEVQQPAWAHDLSTFVTLLLLGWFISPSLYWFPAGLPFLKLGETLFHEDFPVRRLSNFQALILRGWRARLAELDSARCRNAEYYIEHIAGAAHQAKGLPYLRFPIVLPSSAAKHEALVQQDGLTLGMSGMYPASVAAISQLGLSRNRFPEAERLAASLVTLPTNPMLSLDDRSRLVRIINDVLMHSAVTDRVRMNDAIPHLSA